MKVSGGSRAWGGNERTLSHIPRLFCEISLERRKYFLGKRLVMGEKGEGCG